MDEVLYGLEFDIRGGDFSNAGRASTEIKSTLKELGVDPSVVRRMAICAYEAEMNVVMYAYEGRISFLVTPTRIAVRVTDTGPGIGDIELAMREGYSTATEEMQEMGFGAGMGLPNMKRHADRFEIHSEVGVGTDVQMSIDYVADRPG
jgi:serine/threonine-protein kinase RsbT